MLLWPAKLFGSSSRRYKTLKLITDKLDSQKCILILLQYVLYPPSSFPCNLTFVSRLPMSVSCLLQREREAEAERSREGEGKNNRTAIEREERVGGSTDLIRLLLMANLAFSSRKRLNEANPLSLLKKRTPSSRHRRLDSVFCWKKNCIKTSIYSI